MRAFSDLAVKPRREVALLHHRTRLLLPEDLQVAASARLEGRLQVLERAWATTTIVHCTGATKTLPKASNSGFSRKPSLTFWKPGPPNLIPQFAQRGTDLEICL